MITDKFDVLINQMRSRRPILLLGAGFSFGAYNAKGERLLMGAELAKEMYRVLIEGNTKATSILDEFKIDLTSKQNNLKEICSSLRALDMVDDRNNYLKSHFSGCNLGEDASQWKLVNYSWSYIFTLNIDDLVEEIYSSMRLPLTVLDLSNQSSKPKINEPTLIKLHGSVNDPSAGFVFDDTEYRSYTIQSNRLLKQFAHEVLQNDLILVGTEFQEDDLQTVLSIYEESGYDSDTFKRFYITPEISNFTLTMKVRNSNNHIWINRTTEDFLNELEKRITAPNGKRDALKEHGTYFLIDSNKQKPPTLGLYKGEGSEYADFFHNVDVKIPDIDKWVSDIDKKKNSQIISFFGDDFIGKTCCAKRILVELYARNYDAAQINYIDESVKNLLLEYWKTLDKGTNIAIYIDHAAYNYNDILDLKRCIPKHLGKIVFLTEDTTDNHNTKRYVLLDEDNFFEFEIKPDMNDEIALAVYNKLLTKRRLGHYLECIPTRSKPHLKKNKEIIVSKIKLEQDIIDALYFASEGQSFKDHYSSWLKRKADKTEKIVLQQLCCICKLGISSISIILFHRLGKQLNPNFKGAVFVSKFRDVLIVRGNQIYLRRSKILSQLLDPLNRELMISTLVETASFYIPSKETETTQSNIIFQKVIRVNRIISNDLLVKVDICRMLSMLENKCDNISYFWVQYGIAAKKCGNYEDANNHLNYARNIRPYSYQVRHALAKNNMEWGLELIKRGFEEDGYIKYSDGATELRNLLYDKGYSASFRYTVHTMVDMSLKYAKLTNNIIDDDTCEEFTSLLEELLTKPLDQVLKNLIIDFIDYCKSYNRSCYCNRLRGVYHKSVVREATPDIYDMD